MCSFVAMNFEYFLYQYLLKNNTVEVPDFGVFQLTRESAKIDAENAIITPPRETVVFFYKPAVYGNHLAKYIADETGTNLFVVQMNLKAEVAHWHQLMKDNQLLDLKHLGQFQLDDRQEIIKINDSGSDVFGYEEISIQNLQSPKASKNSTSQEYSISKNVIWTFLAIIVVGVAAISIFGNQELIFGKSSHIPEKKNIKKVTPKKAVAVPKKDSVTIDSIKSTTHAKIQKINR